MLNYNNILSKCKEYYIQSIKQEKNDNIPEEIIIIQIYELVLNILNQYVYDYIYFFKAEDIKFLIKYNIDVIKLINTFREYI